MGILDFMGTGVEDPRFQAANAMAQSLLGRGGGLQRLAGGLGNYGSVLEVLKNQELKRALAEAQIKETEAQAENRRQLSLAATQKLAEQQRMQQWVRTIPAPEGQKLPDVLGNNPSAFKPGGMTAPDLQQQLLWESLQMGGTSPQDYIKNLGPKEKKLTTLTPGATLFDPETKTTVFTAPDREKEGDPNKPFMMVNGQIVPNPAYQAYAQSLAAAGAARQTVNVPGSKFEPEYSKEQGKAFSGMMNDINTASYTAPTQIRKIERLSQLLEGVDGGKLAPLGLEVASAANSFGIKIDPRLGNKEAAQALSIEIANGFRKPGTGVMTDKDFENFLAMVPNLSKTAQGRQQITKTMKNALARDIEMGKRARAYVARKGVLDNGFMEEAAQFMAENPVVEMDGWVPLDGGYSVKKR